MNTETKTIEATDVVVENEATTKPSNTIRSKEDIISAMTDNNVSLPTVKGNVRTLSKIVDGGDLDISILSDK